MKLLIAFVLIGSAAAIAQSAANPPVETAAIPNPIKAPASAATSASDGSCIPIKQSREMVGKVGCVTGKVLKVEESRGGNIFVNFCSNYKKCDFSAVILKRESAKVGDLRELEGKVVELRGPVTAYQGTPEIVLNRRDQITVTGEFKNRPERRYEETDFKMAGSKTHHSSFKAREQRAH